MTKYVDIDVAKEAVRKAECDANWDECRFDAEFIENALDFIPAADVAPVVHGRWTRCCCFFYARSRGSANGNPFCSGRRINCP